MLLHLARKHFRRHRIADPAAQRQQGDHEDEEQVAHGVVGGEEFLKVHFYGRQAYCQRLRRTAKRLEPLRKALVIHEFASFLGKTNSIINKPFVNFIEVGLRYHHSRTLCPGARHEHHLAIAAA